MIPILICGQGRTGTTALMKLFSTSNEVFCDSVYPYEKRYLTYWAKLAELLNRDIGYGEFTIEELANFEVSRLGRFPWYYDERYADRNWPPSPQDWLAVFWQAFTTLVQKDNKHARFYAQKSSAWLPAFVSRSFPCEVIYLFRDPRDVYISARMFHARNTGFLAGLEDPTEESELAHRIAFAFIQIFENYAFGRDRCSAMRLKYEDYVVSFESKVAELESRFGLRLKIGESQGEWAQHSTAPTLASSVRRWQKENPNSSVNRKIIHLVGKEMRALGYDTQAVSVPACQEVELSRAAMVNLPTSPSEHGKMTLEEDCARIDVWDTDYWFDLPARGFDTSVVDHIWICLREGAGNVCTVYWRGSEEEFSEDRAFHVEYRAQGAWRILDFPVYRHRNWRGTVAAIRIDLFNRAVSGFGRGLSESPECRGTGYLRWVRIMSISGHIAGRASVPKIRTYAD